MYSPIDATVVQVPPLVPTEQCNARQLARVLTTFKTSVNGDSSTPPPVLSFPYSPSASLGKGKEPLNRHLFSADAGFEHIRTKANEELVRPRYQV